MVYPKTVIDSDTGKERKRYLTDSPHYVRFGKYYLNLHMLQRNITNIRQKSGERIIPNSVVSSGLRNIIMDIVNTKSFNRFEYAQLVPQEQHLLDQIIINSKFDPQELKDLEIRQKASDPKIDMIINRYNELKHQFLEGRWSEEALKELKQTIVILNEKKIISRDEMREALMDICLAT